MAHSPEYCRSGGEAVVMSSAVHHGVKHWAGHCRAGGVLRRSAALQIGAVLWIAGHFAHIIMIYRDIKVDTLGVATKR